MSQAASLQADERSSKELYRMKDFDRQKGQDKEVTSKEWILCGKVTFL